MRLIIPALFCMTLAAQSSRPKVRSQVVLVDVAGGFSEIIYDRPGLVEAPNWSRDGRYLLVNSDGKLWKLAVDATQPLQPVPTGAVSNLNNDHGISPDGKWFAFSAGQIYIMPSTGGQPRQITSEAPSYYHGWSPDGETLAYTAKRTNNFDIYAISRNGGPERRLTTHAGYDDGPDYSPDGKWIYFNSDRSGSWDIWRMPAQGAGDNDAQAVRVTSDDWEDWFPHPSPDGKWLVFLSYAKGTKGHPANQDVVLRKMPIAGGKIEEVRKLFGGQGTINVNSWAPNSKRFAAVKYALIP